MNKNIKKLLVLSAFSLLLTGCGSSNKVQNSSKTPESVTSQHVHDFESDWTRDEQSHWHKCKDASCSQISSKGSHTYDGDYVEVEAATETKTGKKVRTCTECGYKDEKEIPMIAHTHTADTSKWENDANGHWHPATCEHKNEKTDYATHVYGAWEVVKEETYDQAGSKKQVCSVCKYENIQEIPATNEGPESGFTNLAVSENLDSANFAAEEISTKYGAGIKMTINKDAGSDERLFSVKLGNVFDTKASLKAENAAVSFYMCFKEATSFSIKDYKPFSYQFVNENTSSANRAIDCPSDVKALSVVKDEINYWIKVTIPLSSCTENTCQKFDRLNFRIKNSYLKLSKDSSIIIASMYAKGLVEYTETHTFSSEWSSDDNYHWHACTDDGCETVSEKAAHTWIQDPDKTNVPATAETKGIEYKKCEICGKTREFETPKLETGDKKTIEVAWASNDTLEADAVTIADGAGDSNGYSVVSYNQLTKDKQPAAKYGFGANDIDASKYDTISFKIKNLHETENLSLKVLVGVSGNYYCSEATTTSAVSTATSDGQNARIVIAPGDLATYKVKLGQKVNPTRIVFQTAKTIESSGSFWVSKEIELTASEPVEEEPNPETTEGRKVDLFANGFAGNNAHFEATKNGDAYDVAFIQPASSYDYVEPKNYSGLSYKAVKYAIIKIKNTGSESIVASPLFQSKVDSTTTVHSVGGSIESSELGTSQWTRHGSTCNYFTIGAGDTAVMKITFKENVTSINRIRLMVNSGLGAESSGTFTLYEYYIVDTAE